MKALLASVTLTVFCFAAGHAAAAACPDRVPAAINSAAPGSLECQKMICTEGGKYVKAKMKAMSKCLLKEPTGSCPDATAQRKIDRARTKAALKIAGGCGDDAAQAGLSSSYGTLADDAVISASSGIKPSRRRSCAWSTARSTP